MEGENEDADELNDDAEEITLTLVLNRISGGKYQHPNDFWKQLGQMFKNCILSYPDETTSYRKIGDKLRVLAYHLYVDWYSLFKNKDKDRQRRILEAERVKFIELREDMRKKRREEWKANSAEIDYEKGDKKKEGEEGKKEVDKDGKEKEGEDKEKNDEEKKEGKEEEEKKDPNPEKEEAKKEE